MVLRSVTVCGGGGLFRVKRAVVVEGDNSGDFRGGVVDWWLWFFWYGGDRWCTAAVVMVCVVWWCSDERVCSD